MIQYQSSCSKLLVASLSTFPASRMSGSGISNPHLGGMSKGRSKLWYLERDPPWSTKMSPVVLDFQSFVMFIWDHVGSKFWECRKIASSWRISTWGHLHPTPSARWHIRFVRVLPVAARTTWKMNPCAYQPCENHLATCTLYGSVHQKHGRTRQKRIMSTQQPWRVTLRLQRLK